MTNKHAAAPLPIDSVLSFPDLGEVTLAFWQTLRQGMPLLNTPDPDSIGGGGGHGWWPSAHEADRHE